MINNLFFVCLSTVLFLHEASKRVASDIVQSVQSVAQWQHAKPGKVLINECNVHNKNEMILEAKLHMTLTSSGIDDKSTDP